MEKETFTIGLDGAQYWSESATISYQEAVKGLIEELQSNDDIDLDALAVAFGAIMPGLDGVRADGDGIKFYMDNL